MTVSVPTFTPPEALVAVSWCAATADGVLDGEELETLSEHLASCNALGRFGDDELHAALEKAEAVAAREGDAALLKRAADALPADLRATAFYWAADLVMADGSYGPDEARFVEAMRATLGVPLDLAARILDVILLLRRG